MALTDPTSPEPDRPNKKISKAECEAFSEAFLAAEAQENGIFKLASVESPKGRPSRWPYRMCEERDCSHLPAESAKSVGIVQETVIDSTSYDLRDRTGPNASYRTVSAHVCSDDRFQLMAIERRQERNTDATDSLAVSVLYDLLEAARKYKFDLTERRLYSLDSELAHPDDRRLLVEQRIPYAMLLDPFEQFKEVQRPLDDDADVLAEMPVECIFDFYKPQRDKDSMSYLEVRDLAEQRPGPAKMVRELLVEVPIDGVPVHFVVWTAPAPNTPLRDRLQAALEMARRAAGLTLQSPARALRMHEFHHPHDDSYYPILRIVDFGKRR